MTKTAAESWVEMLADLPNIHTTDTADTGSFSYQYASLPSIIDKIRPVLSQHGWSYTQNVTVQDGQPSVYTWFDHASGERKEYGPLTMPAGSSAQQIGSAITYARRYALVAALGLAPDADDDGAAASKPAPPDQAHDTAWKHVFDLFGENAATDQWFTILDSLGLDQNKRLTVATARQVMTAADKLHTEGESS